MTNPKLSAARKRSWETRRKRYGAHGGNRRRKFHVKHAKDSEKSTAESPKQAEAA